MSYCVALSKKKSVINGIFALFFGRSFLASQQHQHLVDGCWFVFFNVKIIIDLITTPTVLIVLLFLFLFFCLFYFVFNVNVFIFVILFLFPVFLVEFLL